RRHARHVPLRHLPRAAIGPAGLIPNRIAHGTASPPNCFATELRRIAPVSSSLPPHIGPQHQRNEGRFVMPRHWRDHEHGHGEYGRGDYGRGDYGRERGERRDDRSAEPGQELSRRDYGGARFTRGMERDVIAPDPGGRGAAGMGPDDMGPDDMRGGTRSNADWSGSGRGY